MSTTEPVSEAPPSTETPAASTSGPTPATQENASGAAAAPVETPTDAGATAKRSKKPLGRLHMPGFGLRSQSDKERTRNPISPVETPGAEERRRVTFEANRAAMSPLGHEASNTSGRPPWMDRRRSSINPKLRPEEDAYHDSRAATKREYKRRATTLQEYYHDNPQLLPQLPFTMHHGFKRWKLAGIITFMVFDACIVPIILYYAMTFGGHVQGWITFAVVTAIWGGPAYIEFAIRSWRLILKSRFYRPLGTTSRWAFDISHWIFVVTITATTALLIVGAAPHIVWIRILSLPGPALLIAIGGCLMIITIYHMAGWKAPFRISSTPKGGHVAPGVYYMVEDIVAVNAAGGLPFREGIAARYEASPIFRKMMRDLSLFWCLGALAMGSALIVIVCVHTITKEVAYGVGWATPFVWAAVWAIITIPWVKHELHREKATWEDVCKAKLEAGPSPTGEKTVAATAPATNGVADHHPTEEATVAPSTDSTRLAEDESTADEKVSTTTPPVTNGAVQSEPAVEGPDSTAKV